jgi:lipid II:glycine glycyltransferase (peptidoglycan interpeptide bridge formation enzyme)
MHIHADYNDNLLSIQDWDAFTRAFSAGHLLQSWTWGEFKAHFGWQPARIAVVEEQRILAAAQVLFRPLLAGRVSMAYVPKGPLLDLAAPSAPAAGALLSALHEACRRRRTVFLKVEPDWEDEATARAWLKAQGFVPSSQTVQPRRTVIIDLRPDEEAILAQMKSKTRYNIRLAERKGVSVQMGTAQDLPLFYELLQVTGRRDGFAVHTQEYYALAWRLFAAQDAVALFLAY